MTRSRWKSGRVRARKSHFKPDGSLDLSQPVGDEFDAVLDLMNDLYCGRTKSQSATRHDAIQTERERAIMDRELHYIAQELHKTLADKIRPQQLFVTSVSVRRDDEINDYVLLFRIRDMEGRPYDVKLPTEAAAELSGFDDHRSFTAVVEHVCTQVLHAREAYHARVAQVLELS